MITKRTKILLVVLVVVALGAYAYLYWWAHTDDHGFFDSVPIVHTASNSASKAVIKPAPVPQTPGETSDTENPTTLTYRSFANTEFGFSFDYPEGWDVSQTTVAGVTTLCVRPMDQAGGCRVEIAIASESVNVSAEKSLEALQTEVRAGKIAESTRRIAGEDAAILRVSGYPRGEEGPARGAVFAHEGRVYVLKGIVGSEGIFDRVASSFSFQD